MPLRELIFSLYPDPPEAVLDAAHKLRYRDYLTVVLIVDRAEVFPDNWIYIHDPSVMMGRIQNYKNWSEEMVPDSTKTSLGLEYFLWEDDEEWSWEDSRLIELGIRESEKIGLVERRDVLDGTVVRMKKAYPVYDKDYQNSVATIQEYLGRFDNLQTVGRNGLHRYNNQDHSMMTGVLAARNILGETHDVWSVNTDKSYHEEQVGDTVTHGDRLVPRRIDDEIETPSIIEKEIDELLLPLLDPIALGTSLGITAGGVFFLATAVLILKGGDIIGPTLALLNEYFWGYTVTWTGAFLILAQAGFGFFLLGFAFSWLRNKVLRYYLRTLQRREEAVQNRDLLENL